MKKPQISYSRTQYIAELAKEKRAARKQRLPSKWGRLIAAGSEDEVQALFFEWVDKHKAAHPVLELIFAVPNGSNKSPAQRAVMQITGLRPGVPDVCVPVCVKNVAGVALFSGLWIEFKRPGGGVVMPNQKTWHERLRAFGHQVEVYDSAGAAIGAVVAYLRLPIELLDLTS